MTLLNPSTMRVSQFAADIYPTVYVHLEAAKALERSLGEAPHDAVAAAALCRTARTRVQERTNVMKFVKVNPMYDRIARTDLRNSVRRVELD